MIRIQLYDGLKSKHQCRHLRISNGQYNHYFQHQGQSQFLYHQEYLQTEWREICRHAICN